MCNIIHTGENTTAFICGQPKDHQCDEKATVYQTESGERFIFNNDVEAQKWYDTNYKITTMSSVACSICDSAAIDNAWRL